MNRTGRVASRAGFYVLLGASLFAFPSVLPWVLGAWIAAFAVFAFRGKPGWPALAFGLGVTLVKRVDWAPGLLVLGVLMIAVGAFDFAFRSRPFWPWISTVVLAAALAGMAWDWDRAVHSERRPAFDPDRPIACVGDSLLVIGTPWELQKSVSVRVLDRSVGGITAAKMRERLPQVLAEKPQVVVLELGFHDWNGGGTRAETMACLEGMILDCRAAGAEVILFEIPRGFITDPYGGLERELGRKYDLEVVTDGAVRSLVLFSQLTPLGWFRPHLSYDGLHPNDEGHRFLAGRVLEALRRVYGSLSISQASVDR